MPGKKKGLRWQEAGSLADTAEAAIRTPVLAARYSGDMEGLLRALRSNIPLTHRDPFIAGQSIAFGMIVWGLINGHRLGDVSRAVINKAGQGSVPATLEVPDRSGTLEVSFTDALLQPSWSHEAARDPAVQIDPPLAACRLFGLACSLSFLLPAAYYFASRFENDFYQAVMSPLNGGGNNMARAALTGALAGAQVGLSGIPEYLIKGLSDHERLLQMAEDIT